MSRSPAVQPQPPSSEKLDDVFELAMEFAEACGTVALTTRDPAELKRLYMQFGNNIALLIRDREVVARIDEVRGVRIMYGHYMVETYVTGKSQLIMERHAELQAQLNSKGGESNG